MTFGSLFAGIGGLDLGLERAGMTCSWQVEIDPYARRVLERHWPDVRRWDDVRTFPPRGDGWGVDLICGGFPCQDISQGNYKAEGLDGARSGLWLEFHRVIRDLRPRYVLIENVSALRVRGMDRLLGSLAEIGFDAEWETLSAAQFGAPHARERIFILAYPPGERLEAGGIIPRRDQQDPDEELAARIRGWPGRAVSTGSHRPRIRWVPEPGLCRVVDGIPTDLDCYRGLGNGVVPIVAEWIGRRILEFDGGVT